MQIYFKYCYNAIFKIKFYNNLMLGFEKLTFEGNKVSKSLTSF